MLQTHTFKPVFDKNSKLLVLGTFPSVKSRENNFYYGHPQNRFWNVIAGIYQCETPQSVKEKTELLLSNGIALWDVIQKCEIVGSADSNLKNIVTNDINIILSQCDINRIYANGRVAGNIYKKYIEPTTGREITILPSTSSANASWSLCRLIDIWCCLAE
ncbi:MAG: DNA-deoxyinosine glycosylase [Eubacteriales bacterium]|jgi:TDG/mug DNA glycosylase family protein|nr:DNA-deoxyinosine glycosylase [Eubacteriales bacterium]